MKGLKGRFVLAEQNNPSLEDSFRESLKDLVTIAEVLGQHCENSISRLVSLSRLALDSEDQLALLMSLVKTSTPRGKQR